MKKVLKIEYIRLPEEFATKDKEVVWRITEQSHREEGFGHEGKSSFTATNHVILNSVAVPQWCYEQTVFVRGEDSAEDFALVMMSGEAFERFLEAVREYNSVEFAESPASIVLEDNTMWVGMTEAVKSEDNTMWTLPGI